MKPLFFATLASLAVSAVQAETIELTVRADQPGKAISPDLVGVFFEDLNYAADGGLYPELIQNRSFEYSAVEQAAWGPLSFWDIVKLGDGDGHLGVGNSRPVHPRNPHYLLLAVTKAGEGVGVANGGFDTIPLQAGKAYDASFWAYQTYMGKKWGGPEEEENEPMPVTIRLEGKDGEVLAEADVKVQGRAWTKQSVTLTPSRSDDAARLVLLAHKEGQLAIDMVSLYPQDTFKGRSNGLRKDLAQAIADLRPKFMRFPGGCLVHGQGIHKYYDWKDTVGPVEQRVGQHNSWGYHETMGLGYFEYFQFCEDIGAKPLPVVSAGVTCQHAGDSPGRGQEGLPMDEMDSYIQDVLDLIEWANGPADSKWGAVRAAAGHPEPFGLQYIGVGNEDAITSVFKPRFEMIRDAIKKQYPEITVVGTVGPFPDGEDWENGWEFARKLDLEMVDEHYYMKPDWFWENLNRYDSYDRSGPKVYVGEYAAHDQGRRNTLRSALAEAAGLTGFERNGDVVHFASYAPLLSRRGHTQWTPDMIYFTDSEMYLTANYYVQKLFGQNSGDRYLDTEIGSTDSAQRLAVSSVADSKSGDLILKIVNGGDEAASLNVHLEGLAADKKFSAVKSVLTAASADAVNEDGQPPAVRPESATVSVSPDFDYEAPANSLTVFRVKR